MRFKLRDELFYYINFNDEKKKLCIFNVFEKKIFEFIHDRQYYENFYKIYNRIAGSIYIKYLFKYFRFYIEHCSEYKFNQIKRHKFYENIIFIDKPEISFYIITIDFVIIFFMIINECDCLLIVIDKFSKRVLIFFDKIIYNITK